MSAMEKVLFLLFGIAAIWLGTVAETYFTAKWASGGTDIVQLSTIFLGFLLLRNESKPVLKKNILKIGVFMALLGLTASSLASITSITPQTPASLGWFHALPTKQFFTLSEISSIYHTGPFLFVLRMTIEGPVWEELVRRCLQKGLTVAINENISLFLVAIFFAVVHKGTELAVLPSFILLGLMVREGFGWFQRAAVHGFSNALILLNSLTFNVGGYYVGKKNNVFILLAEFVFFLIITAILYRKQIREILFTRKLGQTVVTSGA